MITEARSCPRPLRDNAKRFHPPERGSTRGEAFAALIFPLWQVHEELSHERNEMSHDETCSVARPVSGMLQEFREANAHGALAALPNVRKCAGSA
jgi:hypothetical protein